MSTWRCTKTVVMHPDTPRKYVAFTQGKLYKAVRGATPSGDRMLSFMNDQGEEHLGGGKWLFEHFQRIQTCPECDSAIISNLTLHPGINDYLFQCDECGHRFG